MQRLTPAVVLGTATLVAAPVRGSTSPVLPMDVGIGVGDQGFFYWHGERALDRHLIPKRGTWQAHVEWERLKLKVLDGPPAEIHLTRRGETGEVVLRLVDDSPEAVRAAVRRFMPNAVDDDDGMRVPDRFLPALQSEEILAFAWARVPEKHVRTATFASIWVFVLIVDTVRNWVALPKMRRRSLANGFPLDRKMAIAVTAARVLVWRASRRRLRAPVLLGEVPRGRIASARLPFVGGAWRTVDVRLVDGAVIRFLADEQRVDRLVSVLRQTARAE